MKKLLLALALLLIPLNAFAFQVTLTWQDNSDNEDGFTMQAAPSATGSFADIGTVGANVTTFVDPNGTGGKCYRVFAFNGAGNSAFSNVACAATVPNGPTALRLSAVSSTELNAMWQDNSDNETAFKLVTTGKSPPRTFTNYAAVNQTSFLIAGLTKNKMYCSLVYAMSGNTQSAPSNQACATTLR